MANILAESIDKKMASESLQRSEEKFRGLLKSVSDGNIIVNSFGRTGNVNKMLEKMTDYERNELVGKSVELLAPDRYTRHK